MLSSLREISGEVKLEEHELNVPKIDCIPESTCKEPIIIPLSSSASSVDKSPETENQANQSNQHMSRALVLYDPVANGSVAIEAVPERIEYPTSDRSSRASPSVGAFTVQCASCFKWRLIPTKEKYEEIREFLLEQPFVCETAREWRPYISCDDPPDITQDGSRLWAIDKPNIAQPPPGWQRLLRIRGEGSTKFADVYYVAPSGKRLRSMVEIQKYLLQHPEYVTEGVNPARFSFQIPRPLQQNYVRKRPPRLTPSYDGSRQYGLNQVNPVRWGGADELTALQLGKPLPQCLDAPIFTPITQSANKRARKDGL